MKIGHSQMYNNNFPLTMVRRADFILKKNAKVREWIA